MERAVSVLAQRRAAAQPGREREAAGGPPRQGGLRLPGTFSGCSARAAAPLLVSCICLGQSAGTEIRTGSYFSFRLAVATGSILSCRE